MQKYFIKESNSSSFFSYQHALGTQIVLRPPEKYGVPSLFYYDESDGVLIGEEAEEAGQGNQAKNLKREIKLELNSTFIADGKLFSAKEIVGYILDYLKEWSLQVAKTKLIDEPLEGVVISVPAAFEHNEKAFIRKAAEIANSKGGPGLKVLGLIKEPVAAALAYFDNTKILVYDLGGGTCDIAIVKSDEYAVEKYTVIDSDMSLKWQLQRVQQFTLNFAKKQALQITFYPTLHNTLMGFVAMKIMINLC